jgi:hypothetical protein
MSISEARIKDSYKASLSSFIVILPLVKISMSKEEVAEVNGLLPDWRTFVEVCEQQSVAALEANLTRPQNAGRV